MEVDPSELSPPSPSALRPWWTSSRWQPVPRAVQDRLELAGDLEVRADVLDAAHHPKQRVDDDEAGPERDDRGRQLRQEVVRGRADQDEDVRLILGDAQLGQVAPDLRLL